MITSQAGPPFKTKRAKLASIFMQKPTLSELFESLNHFKRMLNARASCCYFSRPFNETVHTVQLSFITRVLIRTLFLHTPVQLPEASIDLICDFVDDNEWQPNLFSFETFASEKPEHDMYSTIFGVDV